ncbi:hypothetical protein E4U59_005076 [Claviceps monticola]|nr:hypothetical protein E4U59_005076 [Claviceps monticola]
MPHKLVHNYSQVNSTGRPASVRGVRRIMQSEYGLPQERADDALPPGQLDILILRPRKQTDQSDTINQFRTQLRVRHPIVAAWPRHLQASHDGYSDVTIDEDFLSQLPDDGDVNADLQTEDVDAADLEDLITEIENDDLGHDVSVISNLGADETELDRLRGILRRGQGELNPSSDIADATGPVSVGISLGKG